MSEDRCKECGRPTTWCMCEGVGDFDFSDTPQEPQAPARKKGTPPPVPKTRQPLGMPKREAVRWDNSDTEDPSGRRGPSPFRIGGGSRQTAPADPRKPQQNKTSHNPGLPPKREAGPVGGRTRGAPQTVQLRPQAQGTPPTGQPAVSPSGKWDVTLPDGRTVRVPAATAKIAQQTAGNWLRVNGSSTGGGTADTHALGNRGANIDFSRLPAVPAPAEEGVGAAAMGGQPQTPEGAYESRLREALREMVREVVRKKAGGGGFVLYGPNKGKKGKPKPSGEFPTRLAAKRAELARFPPKDPDQLRKARRRIDKLMKDPKKRSDAEKRDLSGTKAPKKTGAPAGARKKRSEAVEYLAQMIRERLFRDEEVPGSPWDEKISQIHPGAIASDKVLAKHHKGMEHASIGALGDAQKAMTRALRGVAKVNPGDVAHDPERNKTFMPVMLDRDGIEIGPFHLYIDGGHVRVEVSQDARDAISGLDPDDARDLRGSLMSFEEEHLPKITGAKEAWDERDAHMDKQHGHVERTIGKMTPVQQHLAKQILQKLVKGKGAK